MINDPLQTDDVDDIFDVVLPYLEYLHRKADGETPETIRDKLKRRVYTLHTVGEDGEHGFTILNWHQDRCHCVIAVAWELKVPNLLQIISAGAKYIKQHNCSKITFRSPRKAWERVARRFGAIQKGELYEITL